MSLHGTTKAMPREGTSPEIVEAIRDGCAVPLLPAVSTLSSECIGWDGFPTLNVFHDIPPWQVPEHEHPTHMASLVTSGCTNLHLDDRRSKAQSSLRARRYLPVARGHAGSSRVGSADQSSHPDRGIDVTCESLRGDGPSIPDFEILERWVFKDRHIASLMLALSADLEDGSPAGRNLRGIAGAGSRRLPGASLRRADARTEAL